MFLSSVSNISPVSFIYAVVGYRFRGHPHETVDSCLDDAHRQGYDTDQFKRHYTAHMAECVTGHHGA